VPARNLSSILTLSGGDRTPPLQNFSHRRGWRPRQPAIKTTPRVGADIIRPQYHSKRFGKMREDNIFPYAPHTKKLLPSRRGDYQSPAVSNTIHSLEKTGADSFYTVCSRFYINAFIMAQFLRYISVLPLRL